MKSVKNKKIVAYIRTALASKKDLKIQEDMINNYCINKGYKISKIYIDDGFSGLNVKRPKLRKMINDVKAGNIDIIIVRDITRLFRNPMDAINFLKLDFIKNIHIESLDNSVEKFKNIMDKEDKYKSLLLEENNEIFLG